MLTINEDYSNTCNGEDFIIWKKEICQLAISDDDGYEKYSEFKRLEFFKELIDDDLIIDWLEPTVYKPENDKEVSALILHCSKKDETDSVMHEKTGHWIWQGNDRGYICSSCGSGCLLDRTSDWFNSDFCPHCGSNNK